MFTKKVKDYFDLNKTDGEVGIEIEMELNRSLAQSNHCPSVWRIETDGSLRNNGYEFVLRKPIPRKDIVPTLQDLLHYVESVENNNILPSIRAGVHIHLNVQDLTIGQVLNFMMCYYLLETALLRTCGENREGNLFCLRNQDANNTIFALEQVIAQRSFFEAHSDQYRYAALNFQSLFTYGSLEFRSLATQPDLANLKPWVDVLLQLKDSAVKINNPIEALLDISGDGPAYWAEKILGSHFKSLQYPEMEIDIMRNMREIQVAMYSLNAGINEGVIQ